MVQQFIIIRNMPMPGTEAAKEREERLARKGKLKPADSAAGDTLLIEEKKPAQRQQPVGKNRAKKVAPKKPATAAPKNPATGPKNPATAAPKNPAPAAKNAAAGTSVTPKTPVAKPQPEAGSAPQNNGK
jgi:YidC/Oxa1 family membrane protein insertase